MSETTKSARFRLPDRLPPLSPRLRRPARILWWLLAIVAAGSLVAGVWRGYVDTLEIAPRFAQLGIGTFSDDPGGWTIEYLDEAAQAAGVQDHSRLLAIDGRRVPPGTSAEATSHMLVGPGGPVVLTLRAPDGRVADHRLIRNSQPSDADDFVSDELFFAVTTLANFVAALVTLLVGIMLVRRRRSDPVAMTMSTGFVAFVGGLPVGYPFWVWIGLAWVSDALSLIGFPFLIAAILAFPDGRYVPRWAAWLVPLSIPVLGASVFSDLSETLSSLVAVLYCGAVALFPLVRFRRTPPGIERQQLKWVGLGFFLSMVAIGISLALSVLLGMPSIPFAIRAWTQVASAVILNGALLLMPLSILVAIRRYRLWDADRVIGRSAGWAVLTFAAGTIWAVMTAIVQDFVKVALGASGPGFSAALSTIMALAVLGPLRARVVGWMDQRFRAPLLRLRALPQRLHVWQHADTPEDIGARVSEAVADILQVARAAVLLHLPGGGYRSVGHVGVSDAQMTDWLAADGRCERTGIARIDAADPVFPLRIVLDDAGRPIGALLLGARADGSLFAADETAALAALEPNLAAALRQAQRRQVQERRIGDALAALESRIAAAEVRTRPHIIDS